MQDESKPVRQRVADISIGELVELVVGSLESFLRRLLRDDVDGGWNDFDDLPACDDLRSELPAPSDETLLEDLEGCWSDLHAEHFEVVEGTDPSEQLVRPWYARWMWW